MTSQITAAKETNFSPACVNTISTSQFTNYLVCVCVFRSHIVTDIPAAVPKKLKSATGKNVGIAFGVIFAFLLVVVFAIVLYKPSRR